MNETSIDNPGTPLAASTEAGAEREQVLLAWDTRIKLLGNAHVWANILAAFGISSALLTILLLVISKSVGALAVGGGIFGGFMLLYLMIAVVIDLCGGFKTTFALTTLGVRSVAGKQAGYAADAAFWAGLLTGKLGAMGAGVLAKSEQNVFLQYANIAKVKLRPRSRSILVKGGLVDKPIRLYCTAENYGRAGAILREKCTGASYI